MTIKTIETKAYTIDAHPDPDIVFEWIRNNWHDLAEHVTQEYADSLKTFANREGFTLDYSISPFGDSGDHITFGNVPGDYTMPEYDVNKDNCELTGMYCDHVILSADTLDDIEGDVLTAVRQEAEYIYSDAELKEMCLVNEHYFNDDGSHEL